MNRIAVLLRSPFLAYGLIFCCLLMAYSNSFEGELQFDDEREIGNSETLTKALWPPTQIFTSQRGVSRFSFALNAALFGETLWGYHLVNLLIHCGCSVLVYKIVRYSLETFPAGFFKQQAVGLSLAVALIFAVHPLQTNAVTYLVQRMESLMALFYLLTLWCVIRASETRWVGYLLFAVAFCLLGMRTKEVMVSAPLVIMWYDRAFLASSWRELIRERGWMYGGLCLTELANPAWGMLIESLVPKSAVEEVVPITAFTVQGMSRWEYFRSQPGVIFKYLQLALWPNDQCLDRGWPVENDWLMIVVPGAVLLAMLGLTIWLIFRAPKASFVGGWFFLILAPTSSVVPIADLYFEHRMYLPLLSVVVIVVLSAGYGVSRLREKDRWRQRVPAASLPVVLGVVVVCLMGVTWWRNTVFASKITFWRDCVQKSPAHDRAWGNLASVLMNTKQPVYYEEALQAAEKAVQLDPEEPLHHTTYGLALYEFGRFEEAAEQFHAASSLNRRLMEPYLYLGNVAQKSDPAQAIVFYEKAYEIDPEHVDVLNNYAVTLLMLQRDPVRAGRMLQEVIRKKPGHLEARLNLGKLYYLNRQFLQACEQYQKALEIDPDDEEARRMWEASREQMM